MSLYTLENVAYFRGMNVTDGEIDDYTSYIEMLDADGTITVAGCEFYASQILEECDPTAFHIGYRDWVDAYQCDLEDAIKNEDYQDIEWIEDPEDEDEE